MTLFFYESQGSGLAVSRACRAGTGMSEQKK